MIEAYRGEEPFLFVSYAHADSDQVFPQLEWLQARGARLWYDEGIELGNIWPEQIGQALAACTMFVVFISPRSVASKVVQSEINFALNRGKPLLAVHLEETTLPVGLELRMGDIQALLMYRMDAAQYERKLIRTLPVEVIAGQAERPGPAESVTADAPVVLDAPGPPSRAVSLQFASPRGERNICLFAGDPIRLGRDRANDIVLRVLPRSTENDLASLRMSGHHADLSLVGGMVTWRNAACANGTTIDGEHIGPHAERVLTSGCQLRPSNVLPLVMDQFEGLDAAEFEACRLAVCRRQAITCESPPGPIDAVRLRRGDDLQAIEEYIVVSRGVLFGRGPNCAVCIEEPSLANQHALIYSLAGGLWIALADPLAAVAIDGRPLRPQELAAVVPGSVLLCGSVGIQVTDRYQISLGRIDRA